ncbi:hypothetical protein [Nocardia donostiensis]|uniref:Uncharacterized protein n=1 Tax=Nocardia donostiensis TaxID=1538463 RepID=A0A1V2TM91_9NOCA|nr:hypothetical protein [Nocardia donostiensis]ONM50609.1 hypothetical protein B0T46_01540 [Nocardia donostiensis]OQS20747.1 hypothetical protein B0T44_08925 [Nocardia donostiensis]
MASLSEWWSRVAQRITIALGKGAGSAKDLPGGTASNLRGVATEKVNNDGDLAKGMPQLPPAPVRQALPPPDPTPAPAPEPAAVQTRTENRDIPPATLENSLTNLAPGSNERLSRFGPGNGFSGVYHPESGKILAYPSGDTRYIDSGERPANLLTRFGGHADVNDIFCDLTGFNHRDNVGFVALLRDDGSLGCRWNSASVNGENPSFPGTAVPDEIRPGLMKALQESTGRNVESDT